MNTTAESVAQSMDEIATTADHNAKAAQEIAQVAADIQRRATSESGGLCHGRPRRGRGAVGRTILPAMSSLERRSTNGALVSGSGGPPAAHVYTTPSRLNTAPDIGVLFQITQALARDPRTAGVRVDVTSVEGRIRLAGRVPSAATRDAIVEVVRSTPGVRVVVDDLLVAGPGHPA
ncbi:MAG: BON domain-containing protein [Dehalococcoidia bacterium]|nr:BON domain-containing protein [Dehalococcoidia bacterium]